MKKIKLAAIRWRRYEVREASVVKAVAAAMCLTHMQARHDHPRNPIGEALTKSRVWIEAVMAATPC